MISQYHDWFIERNKNGHMSSCEENVLFRELNSNFRIFSQIKTKSSGTMKRTLLAIACSTRSGTKEVQSAVSPNVATRFAR